MQNSKDENYRIFLKDTQADANNGKISYCRSFPGGSVVKNPPAKQEMLVQSLGQEDTLERKR